MPSKSGIPKKAIIHLSKDPVMAGLIAAVTPKVNQSIGDVYADLLSSIVSQQISTKVAKVIHGRFLDLYQGETPSPLQILDTEYDVLRSVGLSNQKTAYMINIAQFWVDHRLMDTDWNAMSDQQILDLLTQIKGVGEWTVQMILMFTLEREDVLPVEDLVIQLSMVKHYEISYDKKAELKRKMKEVAQQWSPYQTIACKYLWRAKDL